METKEIKEAKIGKSGTGKKGPWTAYQVVFDDGQKASTFDHKIATMAGKTVNVELIQDGQYVNIGSWSEVTTPEPKPEVDYSKLHPKDNKASSVSLSYAKDLVIAGKIELEVIGLVATQFERYCNGEIDGLELGKMIKGIKLPETPKQAPTAKKTALKAEVVETDPDDLPF